MQGGKLGCFLFVFSCKISNLPVLQSAKWGIHTAVLNFAGTCSVDCSNHSCIVPNHSCSLLQNSTLLGLTGSVRPDWTVCVFNLRQRLRGSPCSHSSSQSESPCKTSQPVGMAEFPPPPPPFLHFQCGSEKLRPRHEQHTSGLQVQTRPSGD